MVRRKPPHVENKRRAMNKGLRFFVVFFLGCVSFLQCGCGTYCDVTVQSSVTPAYDRAGTYFLTTRKVLSTPSDHNFYETIQSSVSQGMNRNLMFVAAGSAEGVKSNLMDWNAIDYITLIDYGMSDPQVQTWVEDIPEYGFVGYETTQSVEKHEDGSRTVTVEKKPVYEVTGYHQETRTKTSYRMFLSLTAYTVDLKKAAAGPVSGARMPDKLPLKDQAWTISVDYISYVQNFYEVMPFLLGGLTASMSPANGKMMVRVYIDSDGKVETERRS